METTKKENPQLPQEVLATFVCSFCEFRSLLMLMKSSRFLHAAVQEELNRREALVLEANLPVECFVESEQGGRNVRAVLKLGWSDTYSTKETLVEEALAFCNPPHGNQPSNYSAEVARELLSSRQQVTGWVTNTDFLSPRASLGPALLKNDEEEQLYSVSEPGWGVLTKYGSFVGDLAWGIMSDMISNFDEDEQSSNISKYFLVKECVSVLLYKSHPLSIVSGLRRYDHRYGGVWFSGKAGSLMFHTSDLRRVELFVSTTTVLSDESEVQSVG